MGLSYCDVDLSCGASTQVGLCSIRGIPFDPPLDDVSGHILYFNEDGIVMADVIWQFFQTGSLASFDTGPPPIPVGGWLLPGLIAAGVAATGVGALRRRR
jgi:hypothetical protein